MIRTDAHRGTRVASSLMLGTVLALIAACMDSRNAGAPAVPAVPESLAVPADQVLKVAAHGIGVQIYQCRAATDAAAFAWTLEAPEGQLRYDAGKPLGRHYAGPTWEANDGSRVVGEVVALAAGPDTDAVPWLLLRAKQTSGNGIFGAVRFIQRVRTAGGKAPLTGCDPAYGGTEVRVAYSADYYFYAARR